MVDNSVCPDLPGCAVVSRRAMKKRKKIRYGKIGSTTKPSSTRTDPKDARWDGITTWKTNCSFPLRPDVSLPISFRPSVKMKSSRSFAWHRNKPAPPTCSCSSAGKAAERPQIGSTPVPTGRGRRGSINRQCHRRLALLGNAGLSFLIYAHLPKARAWTGTEHVSLN